MASSSAGSLTRKYATADKLHALLCNKGRYACLRVRRLSCYHPTNEVALSRADLRRHPSLRELSLEATLAAATSDGLIQAVAGAGLAGLRLDGASPLPRFAPAFTSLLRDARRLVSLSVSGFDEELGQHGLFAAQHAVAPFAAALRSNTWLTRLELSSVRLWDVVERGVAVVAALVGHSSVTHVSLHSNRLLLVDRLAVGHALAQLMGANAPALAFLRVRSMELSEEGLRPVLAALPRNTHLRELECSEPWNGDIGKEFVRSTLVPAVRTNTSLRSLWAGEHGDPAEKIVAARTAANGRS